MVETLNPIQQLGRFGQSVWYDNMYRSLITSGELQRLIDSGVTGLTSNPTIFEKAISSSDEYDGSLVNHAHRGLGPEELFEAMAVEDIRAAADLLRPTYDSTDGGDGFASLEVNPHLADDTEGTVSAARRLFSSLDRPNVMIKVPATPSGIPAIRTLIGEGINVNVTLIFSLEMYACVRGAYVSGLEDLVSHGGDSSTVSSVASFFVSRVDTAVDGLLEGLNEQARALMGRAAVGNAKIAYDDFLRTFETDRFGTLAQLGARVQRPLWASTSTKNPTYSDVLYVETLIGPDTVNTMPDATLAAFMEHGTARETIGLGVEEARETIQLLEAVGVSMEEVTTRLMNDGVKAFADSFDDLLVNIRAKKDRLLATAAAPAGVSLGKAQATADEAVASLQDSDVVARVWSADHTLWSSEPTEITNRLGWLDIVPYMHERLGELDAFAASIVAQEIDHVVLLGMGGSSLGPEVLRACNDPPDAGPELIVLDSTIPARIEIVVNSIDVTRTLFIVSSKSGITIEPNSLYRYFRSTVEEAVGVDEAGSRFVAITDAGTPLDELATRAGFRRAFHNPPDLGGRYSVLSYFGMIPAVVSGWDVRGLLQSALQMQVACGPDVPVAANPGAWFGALLGSMALSGRDKLTLLSSPRLSSFPLWVEQLVAESLGKDGKGIVPIVAEPLGSVDSYSDDRMFVYLKLEHDDSDVGELVEDLAAAGHPVIRYEISELTDLGGEFYRWEFAVAIAGAMLGVHPFNQPNVQQAKDMTDVALARFERDGVRPTVDENGSLADLVASIKPDGYIAILAYMEQSAGTDRALAQLRSTLRCRHGIPSTLGYGPRYLHSTGQLHKGGPDGVSALTLAAPHETDFNVPGERYTFGILADAQASSDAEALNAAGRNTVTLVLNGKPEEAIAQLSDRLARDGY